MSADTTYLYLTTTGWKTGQPHQIEIWYVELAGVYYLCAEHRENAHWVQNIRHDATVAFRVGDYTGHARAVILSEDDTQTAPVKALFDAKHHWSDGLLVAVAPS